MQTLEETLTERELAVRRLKKQRDFQSHAFAFVVVNAAVWSLWAVNGGGQPWPAWLTGLWAIGLFKNAWDAYFRRPISEADIQRELKRLHSAH
jgi:hypothetical protein